ncbi:bardet-Biedl syndrome 1 protein [Thecamonas trahens ATCC 50062]|uniref:Bardet-Biedl syndrome 1 protein n=1 Tax=Thecamonas trahens ATCC 50062 TaxID=461836 RepID=A0A0L0DY00_THETB|nr:bardet-Biedl syndrome 1 protein [Thecamonas trahens ATCC 50062]KNC56413.1 bardet-Biedl syndrome 1 protein [Thecamonas trahens ATCC 50062]|eukprot:XP_013760926.1 bardet-Biedl syndrome 1 protein [Thecamonas trahens ATCC 50062]
MASSGGRTLRVTATGSNMTTERKNKGATWLEAWTDAIAGLRTRPACMALGDIHGNGESSLVVGDFSKVLKVFTGKALAHESRLLDPPTAVVTFHIGASGGGGGGGGGGGAGAGSSAVGAASAAVAVASGDAVYVFRNMHPYYKFSLPPAPLVPGETELWAKMRQQPPTVDLADAAAELRALYDTAPHDALSFLSLDVMQCSSPSEIEAYIDKTRGVALERPGVITCMATLHRNFDDDADKTMLVIGTEDRRALILDAASRGLEIAVQVSLPSAPAFVAVAGQYSVGYRITFACRNGRVYTLKAGRCRARPSSSNGAGGTADAKVHAFHAKGKKRYSLHFDSPILSMAKIFLKMRNLTSLAVALASAELRIFSGRALVSVVQLNSPAAGMVFGCYHREQRTLLIAHESGALSVKMLPRSQVSALTSSAGATGPLAEQTVPLALPQRTQVWLDQAKREHSAALGMHQTYQKALFQLKLNTLREYVKLLQQSAGTSASVTAAALPSASDSEAAHHAPQVTLSLRLLAQIVGLGPSFLVKITVTNSSPSAASGLSVVIGHNPEVYSMPRSILPLPLLVPGVPYVLALQLKCLVEGASDAITALVVNSGSDVPLISYKLQVPVAEVMLDI